MVELHLAPDLSKEIVMVLKVQHEKAPKVLRSVRITIEAADILDGMSEAFNANHAYCVDGLIKEFGPATIKRARSEANARKKTRTKKVPGNGTG